jgi:hypothetical protein
MNSHLRRCGVTAAAIVVSCMASMPIAAQQTQAVRPPPGGHNFAGQSDSPPRAQIEAMMKAAEAKPTPRTADGHPDLSGAWGAPQLPLSAHQDANGNFYISALADKGGTAPILDATPEEQLAPEEVRITAPYKPELLAKVKELASAKKFYNDPAEYCKPEGVPRAGAPGQIVQSPTVTVFLYTGEEGPPASFRVIPTDGRPHRTDVDPTAFGDSIGHWEGDTLVVDVTHLSEDTMMGNGYFHSEALHVVERYTRKGNTLRREATAEDSNVLTKPWVIPPQTRILTDDMVYDDTTCQEREASHIVNKY